MKETLLSTALVLFFVTGVAGTRAADTYTYPDLVKQLTDLERIAQVPPEGEKGGLASSYNRISKYDEAADKYLNWYENLDGSGFVRKEGEFKVFADIQGPGCIWRMWAATIRGIHVKIYLDGDEKPAIDLPFDGYFNGKSEPFTRSNLVYRTSADGFDDYTPISFQKSCKIVADPNFGNGWADYFQYSYTIFPPGTTVPTFKLPLSGDDSAALDEANRILGNCGVDPAGERQGQQTETKTVAIDPGQTGIVADLDGAGAITALRCHIDGIPAGIDEQTNFLRQIALRITWDKQDSPAVWSPIGDFFADAAGTSPYSSLVSGFTKDKDGQFYCYWYMPYASHATVAVDNDSAKPVSMSWEVVHAPLTKPIDTLLRFHAKWHRDTFLPTRKDRELDWTLLTTKGKGRYVGTQLHIWSPRGGWWGEGDEKFFLEGEKFPSIFGTGSEDYFGYAWSSGKTFTQALHGQPTNENNKGHISVHRWHIADNVPFQQSFDGYIEKHFPNSRPTLYASVVYWYLTPDGTDPYAPVPVADRVGYWTRTAVYVEPDAIEGESLKVISQQPPGTVEAKGTDLIPEIALSQWSGDRMLEWRAAAPGNKLELDLPVAKAGKYKVLARFNKAPNYGTFQASIDGNKAGDPQDLYSPALKPADPVELGTFDLTADKHVLSFEAAEKNKSSGGSFFGLDYIKLVPVQ